MLEVDFSFRSEGLIWNGEVEVDFHEFEASMFWARRAGCREFIEKR
jgi:hypothetical protein